MRSLALLFCGTTLVCAATYAGFAGEKEKGKQPDKVDVKIQEKIRIKTNDKHHQDHKVRKPGHTGDVVSDTSAGGEHSADEQAIREAAKSFQQAYDKQDATAAAAHFTDRGEYVDVQGNVHHGRKEIESSMAGFFKEHPGSRIEININSIRFVSPDVAIEDGTTTILLPSGKPLVSNRYSAVDLRHDGKWLVASARDSALDGQRKHSSELRQLDWLLGEWVDEGEDSTIVFSGKESVGGNFLLRDFTVSIGGHEAMNGTQRVGFDPASGHLRAWTFDSEGGFFEGVWAHEDDRWTLKATGITADGETAKSTSVYKLVNPHLITWQLVEQELNGKKLPDSDEYKLVRKGPLPEQADHTTKSDSDSGASR